MATSTVEQYLKIIYQQQQRSSAKVVQMKQLADAMGVTPGTATSMVKYLDREGYIRYTPRQGVELRDSGRRLALSIVRRHRLIETFLEQVLGYDWTEVHQEAEQLEHAVSDLFVRRLDAYLGYPTADPHGDPIPTEDGRIETRPSYLLAKARPGDTVEIVRLREDSTEFLGLMKRQGLLPQEQLEVRSVDKVAGVVTVRHAKATESFSMSYELAGSILVRSVEGAYSS
ncbi:MAG: metal-dependent transcriptional regulator [Alkalispirochaetaceae bacterium]